MNVRKAMLAVFALLPLWGCSSDPQGSGSDTSTSGDPGSRPTGAVNMEVYATMTQTCPPGNVHIDIGNVQTAPPQTVVDGQDGATVSCAVLPQNGKFAASGTISQASFFFSFNDVLTDGLSATGNVSFQDPATGTNYTSNQASLCVFQFAPGTDQGIEAGKISVQFDCSNLISEVDPAASCSSRYGYLLLSNCEGS